MAELRGNRAFLKAPKTLSMLGANVGNEASEGSEVNEANEANEAGRGAETAPKRRTPRVMMAGDDRGQGRGNRIQMMRHQT